MALTDLKVRTAKPTDKPYKLTDSDGMLLLVHPNGSKYWRMQYRFANKQKMLALGVYPEISLANARQRKDAARVLLANGIDPSEKKKEVKIEQQSGTTFEDIARAWYQSNKKWSAPHAARVLRGLEVYLFPFIGKFHISKLETLHLLAPIKTVENQGKFEVAARLQQRIIAIMRFAVQHAFIRHNPAQDIAGAVSTSNTVHRPALPFERFPELLNRIDSYQGRKLTQLAVQFTLLTFIRSSELRFARWSEIDFKNALWTIPAEREPIDGVKYSYRGSKMKTAHLVPLSRQAMNILKQIHKISGTYELIFIGDHDNHKPMSENTVNKALRVMGYDTKTEVCGHGFRAMACSALVESSLWVRDAVERQMSHQERNGVRAAYIHKAEHLEERQLMIQWWADYLDEVKVRAVGPFEFGKETKLQK